MTMMRRGKGARAGGRAGRGERGFTLVELMVALVVSSLLVGMLFAIFIRMSVAYRGQQQVAEVQGKLAAARAKIEIDAKQAGLAMANGFYLAAQGPGRIRSPLRVINNADGPDEVAFYYADTSVRAPTVARTGSCTRRQCDKLESTDGFAVGDLVVMSTVSWVAAGPGSAQIARFEACVLQISDVGARSFELSQSAPWGSPGNTFCPNDPVPGTTMFYKLAARHWRIDPTRPADGVLQLSTQGAMVGVADWQDQAYGFTDLQVATRFFEKDDGEETRDPDRDPTRDWYSGEDQELATDPAAPPELPKVPIQISISLVARTERDVEGIASSSTPSLTVTGNEGNNTIGDRAAIALPSALPALAGNRIYRYTTFQVDLRNLGVGR
jgi:prepilin-type N-terminal cleavage/methylation domain-containing protein